MSPWAASVAGLLLGYALGSIPASYLAGRLLRGIDLRQAGSGNLGATNAFRVLGPIPGAVVMVVDVAKGVVAVLIGLHLLPGVDAAPDLVALLAAVGAVLGHSLSPFVGFRGGKGVAAAAGAFGTLAPGAMIPAFGVWLVLLLTTRIMSIASIAAATVLPINLATMEVVLHEPGRPVRIATLVASLLVGLWVILRHRSNLQRLRSGTEKGLW